MASRNQKSVDGCGLSCSPVCTLETVDGLGSAAVGGVRKDSRCSSGLGSNGRADDRDDGIV
jgi:hypothetical protein